METPEKTFTQKILGLAKEVGVIVLGVLISIWATSQYESNKEQNDVEVFLQDLKESFRADTATIGKNQREVLKNLKEFEFIESLTQAQIDSTKQVKGSIQFHGGLFVSSISTADYEGFKASGKLGTIENKKLKKLILEYYEDGVPILKEIEKMHQSQYLEIFDLVRKTPEKSISKTFLDPKMKATIEYYNAQTRQLSSTYDLLKQHARELMKEINNQ